MQVTLGIASNGLWKDVMGVSLLQSLCTFPYDLHIASQRGPHIDENREVIVRQAMDAKSDVLLFVDTDMAWPVHSLGDLLIQSLLPGQDIVGAAYNEKRLPKVSTVKMFDQDGGIFVGIKEVPRQPFKCAAVGAGFMAINLHRLVECWPDGPYFEFGAQHGLAREGEDVHFSLEAAKHGLTVWCDPRIVVHHIGDFAF